MHIMDQFWPPQKTIIIIIIIIVSDNVIHCCDYNIIMEMCKDPTLRLKALNKHSITHIMYIKMENVIRNLKTKTKNFCVSQSCILMCISDESYSMQHVVAWVIFMAEVWPNYYISKVLTRPG